MMKLSVACLLVVLLAATRSPHAQLTDTTGQTLAHAPGYTMRSNVAGYLKLSTDICEIKALLEEEPPNYEEARKIYIDGKNSFKSDGSQRTLRGMATTSYGDDPIYRLYATYWDEEFNTTDFLDAPISRAFDGQPPYLTDDERVQAINKGIAANLQFLYLMHELDEAAGKIRANDTDPTEGAPHNIDETFAIYFGETPDCAPAGDSLRRGKNFGTMVNCEQSEVNARMVNAHNAAYNAALAGDLDAFEDVRDEILRLHLITYTQAVTRYADFAETDQRTGNDPTKHQAEGYAFYRTIAPVVWATDADADAAIRSVFEPGSTVSAGASETVTSALESVYPGLRITADEIGKQNQTVPALEGCEDTSGAAASLPAVALAMAGAAAVFFAL